MLLDRIEVVTLFVDDIDEAKAFYQKVFAPEVVYQDAVSSVLKFSGTMINLLKVTEAPQLVEPSAVAAPGSGARVLLTIKVDAVDAVCAELRKLGVRCSMVRSIVHGAAAPRPLRIRRAMSGRLRRNCAKLVSPSSEVAFRFCDHDAPR
ncbi:lactoylglutathione lyase-like lyase [Rhizobium leguminosarum bv. viciae WSM1455]|nr:lactoylglutathione lyase-like lyase [Rhizobium leguminosarum bv. viciae WSM1455]